jgi:hypothetical protein
MLVKKYLEAGANSGEITFYITTEAGNAKVLAEKYPSNFCLFLCNPRADAMIQDLQNIYKLKGMENLTEIDIALTKAFRAMNPAVSGLKRACIETVSDALLQHLQQCVLQLLGNAVQLVEEDHAAVPFEKLARYEAR